MPLTRVYVKRPLQSRVHDYPDVRLGVYVDDIGQFAASPSDLQNRRDIVGAALQLLSRIRALRLTVSAKIVIVSSSCLTAKVLRTKLAERQLSNEACDLGVQYSSRSRRLATVLKKRMVVAKH